MSNKILLYFIILIIVIILFLINLNLKIENSLVRINDDGSSELMPYSIIKALGLDLFYHRKYGITLPFTQFASPLWGPFGGPEGAGWQMLQYNILFIILIYSIIYWTLINYYNKSQIIKTTQTKNKIKIDNVKTEKKNNIKINNVKIKGK